jgi:hypothetical protein
MTARHSEIDTAEIVRLYLDERMGHTQIAARLNCTRSLVGHRLKVAGAMADPRAATPFRGQRYQRRRGEWRTEPEPGSGAAVLVAYLARDGRTPETIAKAVPVDASYLARLRMGDRRPSEEMVERLSAVLGLSAVERDTLAHAFGWCPPSLRLLTAWSAWLTTLVQALATEARG